MNIAEYKTQRAEFLKEMKAFIDAGESDKSIAKSEEVEALDARWEIIATANANNNSFNRTNKVTDIYNQSKNNITGKVLDIMNNEKLLADIRSGVEYREAFIKTLQGTATPEQKNLVTATTGAAVIPTETFSEIIQNIRKQQGVLSKVRILEIPGRVSIPLSDINTPAAWHVEGTEIDPSDKEPGSLVLGGYELAKLFTMSAATKAMSIPAYEAYLVQELTRCTADALNSAIFSGVGTTQPTGINALVFDAGNSVTTAAVKTIAYDEMVSMLALLASNFRQNAAWIMNSTTYYAYVATMKDEYGRAYFTEDRPLGKELIIDDFAPDNSIFLGDPSFYFFNFSAPVAIEADSSAGFSKGVTMFRSLSVVDGKPLPSGAFAKLSIKQA